MEHLIHNPCTLSIAFFCKILCPLDFEGMALHIVYTQFMLNLDDALCSCREIFFWKAQEAWQHIYSD